MGIQEAIEILRNEQKLLINTIAVYNSDYLGLSEAKKVCAFCADANKALDYKDVALLKKYVSERGKILPRRITGNCAKHQRALTVAVKRARHVALMPYSID